MSKDSLLLERENILSRLASLERRETSALHPLTAERFELISRLGEIEYKLSKTPRIESLSEIPPADNKLQAELRELLKLI